MTGTKKRKRSAKDQLEQEHQERCGKLLYQCRKALHKECKIVKSFECQKLVRRLKKEQDDTKDTNDLETKLTTLKAFAIDLAVEKCLKNLGMDRLVQDQTDGSVSSTTTTTVEWIDKFLQHKRVRTAMEVYNTKMGDLQRWYLGRQETLTERRRLHNKKRTPTGEGPTSHDGHDTLGSATAHSLFVSLDGKEEETTNEYDMDEYAMPSVPVKKKNRPGQRARKAKAMAMEARKQGKTWDRSHNWRAPKPKQDDNGGEEQQQQQWSAGGKDWKDEGKQHPSWVARQSQKPSIAKFAGKKIKFGQDSSGDVSEKGSSSVGAATPGLSGKDWKDEGKQHPSWVARQSQKPSIAKFAGKKIKFGQDDDATTDVPEKGSSTIQRPNVSAGKDWKDEGKQHPSWAARQSQKTGIAKFAGKKITFD